MKTTTFIAMALACLSSTLSASFFVSGVDFTHVHFKPEGEAAFTGSLSGFQFEYGRQTPNAAFLGFEFDWRKGSMRSVDGKRDLVDMKVAEKLGYTCNQNGYFFSLHTGFGFRLLDHHFFPNAIGESTFSGTYFPPRVSSANSLAFKYFEFFLPFGFYSEYRFDKCLSLGFNFDFMPQLLTSVMISPLCGVYWKIVPSVRNFIVEFPFIFNLTRRCNLKLVINPYYEKWHDGATTATTSNGTPLGLPGNEYKFSGLELNLLLLF